MAKNIICYSLGKIEPKKRLKFHQELYGHIDRSNHGKYEYQRKGILTGIKYKKPLDSTLIVPRANAAKIKKHLRRYQAKYINIRIIG
jgi:hypothetical protein